jgi:hypothetical protein
MQFDAPADFSEREHAEERFVGLDARHPSGNAGVAMRLPQFRNDAGIQEIGHQSSI